MSALMPKLYLPDSAPAWLRDENGAWGKTFGGVHCRRIYCDRGQLTDGSADTCRGWGLTVWLINATRRWAITPVSPMNWHPFSLRQSSSQCHAVDATAFPSAFECTLAPTLKHSLSAVIMPRRALAPCCDLSVRLCLVNVNALLLLFHQIYPDAILVSLSVPCPGAF